MSKCCDKLGIIHQIEGIGPFCKLQCTDASRLTYMQVDMQKKTLNDLVINTLPNYYGMSIR